MVYRTLQWIFNEQASHIGGPQTNFPVSPRPSHGLLIILKNTLGLEQRSNRNQEFTNRKQRGPQRNSVNTLHISKKF
jgi:hypothetical protein